MHHNKEYPRSPQLKKACVQQGRPNAAKNKIKFKNVIEFKVNKGKFFIKTQVKWKQ